MREETHELPSELAAERFRGLALRYRGRTGLTQRELAARVGVHVRSIQDWEAGLSRPTRDRLRRLVLTYLRSGGFVVGQELAEARVLWQAAAGESRRSPVPFDEAWFAELLAEGPAAVERPAASGDQDWGEAPDVSRFIDRRSERATLGRWIVDEQVRVVQVVGLPGVGKTLLATRVAQDLAPAFDRVLWRTLRHAPAPSDWLASAVAFLAPDQPPAGLDEPALLARVLDLLRQQRCLVVLDNLETVLAPGAPAGRLDPAFAGFGDLLRAVAERQHQSCLLLTSREQPAELEPLVSDVGPVRALRLAGLDVAGGRALVGDRHLVGDEAAWEALVQRCSGNALALRLAAARIRELFDGAIAPALHYLADLGLRDVAGLRGLLEAELERVSDVEWRVLRWLTIEGEALNLDALATLVGPGITRAAVFDAVSALWQRSLLERAPNARGLSPPSVVLEYLTERLVDEATEQLVSGQLTWLRSQPLIRATAPDFVRQTQERILGTAVVERLVGQYGSRPAVQTRLDELLARLRRRPLATHGFAAGALINLLRLVRGDLRGADLARLSIRQAHLQEVEAQDASLAGAELIECVLADAFDHPVGVGLSRDGRHLAIGTMGGEVRGWRLPERTPVLSLAAHTGMILALAVSADGRLLASGGLDGALKLWELATGRLLLDCMPDASGVRSVALSADGRVLASGGFDASVKVWDTTLGELTTSLVGHRAPVAGVALSEDGRLAASCASDGSVKLWDVAAARERRSLGGHARGAWAIGLSPSGRLVASGGLDGTVLVWSADTGAQLAALHGHAGPVWGVVVSSDERLLASSGFDRTVRVWELPSGHRAATLANPEAALGLALGRTPAAAEGGWSLASASRDGTVRIWDVRRRECALQLRGALPLLNSVALDGRGDVAVAGSASGTVQVWDVAQGRLVAMLEGHAAGVSSVTLGEDGRRLVSGGLDDAVVVWDLASGQQRLRVPADSAGVWTVALSSDDRLLISGGGDGTIKVWDAAGGRLRMTLQGHVGPVISLAVRGSDQLLASGGVVDATVRVWDPATGRRLLTLRDGDVGGALRGLALTPDGQRVIGGGSDGTLKVWSVGSGELLARLPGHTAGIWSLALSRDGTHLATGGGDGTVKRWEPTTGTLLGSLVGHRGPVLGVAHSADGRLLASCGCDGTLRVWELATGSQLRVLRSDRCYERVDITGLRGITEVQRQTLLDLGAVTLARPAGQHQHEAETSPPRWPGRSGKRPLQHQRGRSS